jgi:predicted 2-oxoglutarate/Fe(II)-dependent dioxygenase YbiX
VKTPKTFAAALAETCLPSVFNPYRETCAHHDHPEAVRRRNLKRCLEAALDARVDTIWIARDLGYRGGRRTGVPLTDEVHLGPA